MQQMHPVFIMYWKRKIKTLQPGTVSQLQKKIPSCISCSLIIVSLRPVPKEPGQSELPQNYNGD